MNPPWLGIARSTLVLVACLALLSGTVRAQTPDAQKAEIQALQEKLQQIERISPCLPLSSTREEIVLRRKR